LLVECFLKRVNGSEYLFSKQEKPKSTPWLLMQ
jgi:hypothetical protein